MGGAREASTGKKEGRRRAAAAGSFSEHAKERGRRRAAAARSFSRALTFAFFLGPPSPAASSSSGGGAALPALSALRCCIMKSRITGPRRRSAWETRFADR